MVEYDYRPNRNNPNQGEAIAHQKKQASLSLSKVFLWLGIGLLITGLVSLGLPNLLLATISDPYTLATTYVVMIAVSAIVMFPCSIMMIFFQRKVNPTAMMITYFLYTIAMGVLLSSVFLEILADSEGTALWQISLSFLITAACFMIMGVIGIFTKRMNAVIPIVSTLAIGCLIISLVNVFLGNSLLYWITDFVIFALILLVTAIDMHNINQIVSKAPDLKNGTSLAIYCAYILYVDFIYVFIRVLTYVSIVSNRRK